MPSPTAMRIYFFPLIFLTHFLLLLSTSPAAISGDDHSSVNDTPTVYQVLEEYGFPVGILPQGVAKYDLDRSTGRFTVYLDKTCSFTIKGYNLRYKTRITGVISYQRLSDLNGVQVKILFLWLGIGEVSVDGGDMDFSVGIVSAGFPLDSFYESPQCGCGFDCVDHGRFGWKHLVSSS